MTSDDRFYHQRLPPHSTLLAGREPPDLVGWTTDLLQIWYNRTDDSWADPAPHFHTDSDEVFVVLRGELVVEVEGRETVIRPGEFCCFRRGVVHTILDVKVPAETLMIRAPSLDDKQYVPSE